MLELYERRALMRYCHRLCSAPHHSPQTMQLDGFAEWACRVGELQGIDPESLVHEGRPQSVDAARNRLRVATRNVRMPRKRSALQCRVDGLVKQLNLDPLDGEVIAAIARYHLLPEAAQLFDGFGCDLELLCRPQDRRMLARALNASDEALRRRVMRGGSLYDLGLIDLDAQLTLPSFLKSYLDQKDGSRTLADHVLGNRLQAGLSWEDFAHLGQERDHLAQLLAGVREAGKSGINILLYGAPGVGKTELCKTLASHLSLPIHAVGEHDDHRGEPSRIDRMGAITIARSLITDASSAALLVDEAEDILSRPFMVIASSGNAGYSRVYAHRLLEGTTCPTFWVMNAIDRVEPSVLRRMTYAIEVRPPGIKSRSRIWHRLMHEGGIACTEDEAWQLGREFRSGPAIAETAVESARLSGGSVADVRRVAGSLITAMQGGVAPRGSRDGHGSFDRSLVNASVDLGAIEATMRNAPHKPLSFCIHGPSGTGKSAYLRHLAGEAGLDVLHVRASDLLSMFVGESEQKVAETFRQAREDHSFLVIDEADALLSQRSGDRKSWENSLVSEILTWMEEHPLPFGMTTNNIDQLDRASLRRFTFRIHFDYLRAEQLAQACEQFLGMRVPLAGLPSIACATVADVLLTQRQAEALGVQKDAEQVVHLLRETVIQREGFRRPIGFAV